MRQRWREKFVRKKRRSAAAYSISRGWLAIQAYDAAFGGIYEDHVNSLTYAISN
jgi:hypothetical protein